MPNLQNDYLALVLRQSGQPLHGLAFSFAFVRRVLEPPQRLELARDAPPQTAPIIQRPIPISANAVMLRLGGRTLAVHERDERFLQDVFGFGVRQTESAAIEKQLRPPGPVQGFEPCRLFALNIHSLTG